MTTARRPWLITATVFGAAIVAFLAFGVFGVHLLFIDEEVSEAAPVFTSTATTDQDDTASHDAESNDAASGDVSTTAEDSGSGGQVVAEPVTTVRGEFIDGAHPTVGTALVLSDGGATQRVLRLEDDFATDNGPDLNIYLATSADGFGDDYVDLGDLKGNVGSQNYEIAGDVDLTVYNTVVIWCVRFGVGFGSAGLA